MEDGVTKMNNKNTEGKLRLFLDCLASSTQGLSRNGSAQAISRLATLR